MHDGLFHLELTFPMIPTGSKGTPFDLKQLLYRGGASIRRNRLQQSIQQGLVGGVLPERVELVSRMHEAIEAKLAKGGSVLTAITQIKLSIKFFRWADQEKDILLSVTEVHAAYLRWAEYLFHRNKVVKDLSDYTIYTTARCVGQVLDEALGRPTPMIELTRIREPKRNKKPLGIQADKQNLQKTFEFGHLLQDICDGLPLNTIWGPRPVRILLRDGCEIVQWMGKRIRNDEQRERQSPEKLLRSKMSDLEYENNKTLKSRANLINMRIIAEMLMFLGQTGMNLAQASHLELRHFSYSSDIDGYKVRDYKARRGGEVLFNIFKEYRGHFERYLDWRRTIFPDEMRLFPVIRRGGHISHRPCFELIQKPCERLGVSWMPPNTLRGTRINWLLRRSGDADLTAEMAQHSKTTLLSIYEIPSHQRAITEITRFWQSADPKIASQNQLPAIAPGTCDGIPEVSLDIPKVALLPDCIRPSGCLWCEHHRDIDSFDYVWALSCFRHLKVLEISRYCPPSSASIADHPAQFSIQRLTEKLAWFRESNAARRTWVDEALFRIDEGHYHMDWAQIIDAIEGASV